MHLVRSERGSVIIAVMGIMVVLTILAIGAFEVSQSNIDLTGQEKNATLALSVAEAGVDKAVWQLKAAGSLPSSMTVMTTLGSAEVSVTSLANFEWQIVSRGATTEAPNVKRAVKVSVFSLSLWNFFMASSLTAGGGGMVGNTSVYGPFYVRGGVTIGGNSEIQEGPFFVKAGDINLSGNGKVGTPADPIYVYNDGSHPEPGSNNFYCQLSTNVPDLHIPPLRVGELQSYENVAASQSADDKMGDTDIVNDEPQPDANGHAPGAMVGYYKVIDDDRTVSGVGNGTHGLTINSTTPSWGVSSHGNGEDFAWDQTNKILYVKGTVFVDGPVNINTAIKYEGNGTLVANGDIYVADTFRPVGPYPNDDVMGLVTPTTIRFAVNGSNNTDPDQADIWGAFFATNKIQIDANDSIRGSMLSGLLAFTHPNGHLFSDAQLPSYLPESMPGSTERYTYLASWREVK